jgi:hypothetical protein
MITIISKEDVENINDPIMKLRNLAQPIKEKKEGEVSC